MASELNKQDVRKIHYLLMRLVPLFFKGFQTGCPHLTTSSPASINLGLVKRSLVK